MKVFYCEAVWQIIGGFYKDSSENIEIGSIIAGNIATISKLFAEMGQYIEEML